MNARVPPSVLNAAHTLSQVSTLWDDQIVPQLQDYIRIPAKSPMFDADWAANVNVEEISARFANDNGFVSQSGVRRASAFGYFGHMWELYTLWVLVPLILATRFEGTQLSLAAFAVIGVGSLGCIVGGFLAQRLGSAWVATLQLILSGLCCVLAPWLLDAPIELMMVWLMVWGVTAAGDSPQFSTLTASNAPPQAVGSVLTLTNSIGFGISIVSIELFTNLAKWHDLSTLLPWLGLGPLLGIWAMRPLLKKSAPSLGP